MSDYTKKEKSLQAAAAPRTITTDIPYPTNPIKVSLKQIDIFTHKSLHFMQIKTFMNNFIIWNLVLEKKENPY